MNHGLLRSLKVLKSCGAKGLKTSFEDEGAHPHNVYKLRNITNKVGLDLTVKIGGAEARTDFRMAVDMDSDGIVAPMIESPFALSKFTSYTKSFDLIRGINIESKQAVENLDFILTSEHMKYIDYICVGRSDLASSYEEDVFSSEFCKTVTDVLTKIKNANVRACMGGSFDYRSFEFVKYLHEQDLIDKVETRYIVFDANENFIKKFDTSMNQALQFEREYMTLLYEKGYAENQEFFLRRDEINKRLSQQIDYR